MFAVNKLKTWLKGYTLKIYGTSCWPVRWLKWLSIYPPFNKAFCLSKYFTDMVHRKYKQKLFKFASYDFPHQIHEYR